MTVTMSILERLIGQTVQQVSDDVATYIPIEAFPPFPEVGQAVILREIILENYKLIIANPTRLSRAGIELERFKELVGKTVGRVEENEESAVIELSGDLRLEVDLREESFTGPEAMVLHGPNDLIVVWN